MSYKRMKVDKSVCHDSDFSPLPKDAVIIKTFYKYSYQHYILEHKYQVIRYKQSDGYNVYMYIDKELVDTKHLCCLAHARAKFVLSPTHPSRGELIDKAVNYLQIFWKQLFAYLNDGRYDIDNSIAEVSSVRWRVSARTRCSLLAAAWQMYRQPIIRCSQHAECMGCQLWNILRNSSTKLPKVERIMKICCL